MNEFSSHRESKLKSLQQEVATLKKDVAKEGPSIMKKQRELDIKSQEISETIFAFTLKWLNR